MNDSDPRPMPPQVLAAYRDPLNLTELFSRTVFTDRERLAVRDELLERLIKKHGNVEVEIGKGGRTLPIRKRVAQFKKSVLGSIEVMIASEEFGGREAVMLELASIMQPYWLRWWGMMSWADYPSTCYDIRTSGTVLGNRQIVWIAAQYARSVIDLTPSRERQNALDAVLAAESWSIAPSEEILQRAGQAVGNINNSMYDSASQSAASAASAAIYSVYPSGSASSEQACNAADSAARAARISSVQGYASRMGALCELTKRLITPTLITHASRGLR